MEMSHRKGLEKTAFLSLIILNASFSFSAMNPSLCYVLTHISSIFFSNLNVQAWMKTFSHANVSLPLRRNANKDPQLISDYAKSEKDLAISWIVSLFP